MDFKGWIMSILIAIIVFVAFGATFTEMASTPSYNVTISDEFKGAYTNTTQITSLVNNVSNYGTNISDSVQDSKNLDNLGDPVKDQYKTFRFIFSSFNIVKNMLLTTSEVLHLPPMLVSIAIAIVVITITFLFLKSIFGWVS